MTEVRYFMKMKSLFLFLLFTCSALMAENENKEAPWFSIQLKTGEKVFAPVLYQDKKKVVVEIQQKLMRFDRSQIAFIENKKGEVQKNNFIQSNLYSINEKSATGKLEDKVKSTQEAVVTVRTTSGIGSGFFISSNGYLVTNVHVVEGETNISVTQYPMVGGKMEKKVFDQVKLVALNPVYDLALLKVSHKKKLPFVTLGDSDRLERGEPLYAIGNPQGLERSVSSGIVSVLNQTQSVFFSFGGNRYLQTTVQVNSGNSGGPLFNLAGEVIGVINMKLLQSEGLGFAIPSYYLKDFLNHYSSYLYDEKNSNSGIRYLVPPFLKGKNK